MNMSSFVGHGPTLLSGAVDSNIYAGGFITAKEASTGMNVLRHHTTKSKLLERVVDNPEYKTFSHGVLIGMQHRLMRTIDTMDQVYTKGIENITQNYENVLEMLLFSMASTVPNTLCTCDKTQCGVELSFNHSVNYPKTVVSQLATIDNRHVALELNLILKAQEDLRNLYDCFLSSAMKLTPIVSEGTSYMKADIAKSFRELIMTTDRDVREALFPGMDYVLNQCMTA